MSLAAWRGLSRRAGLPGGLGACAVALALLVARPAAADDEPGALSLPPHHHAFLAGDELRWRQHELVPGGPLRLLGGTARNIAFDLLAMPAGVTTWSAQDFATLLAVGSGVLAFMVGPLPLDAQVQLEVRRLLGPREARFQLWTPLGDALIFGVIGALSVGSFLMGWFSNRPALVELGVLMVEAFAVAQIFHLGFKLLLGREGPKDADGLGVIWGPSRGVALFPAGTPSGHAMSVYALMGVVSAYVNNPWLTAALQALGLAFCTTMLIDDYHFVSDLVWGAAMGWAVGEWVVRHRSSRFVSAGGPPVRVVPVAELRTGTLALLLSATF